MRDRQTHRELQTQTEGKHEWARVTSYIRPKRVVPMWDQGGLGNSKTDRGAAFATSRISDTFSARAWYLTLVSRFCRRGIWRTFNGRERLLMRKWTRVGRQDERLISLTLRREVAVKQKTPVNENDWWICGVDEDGKKCIGRCGFRCKLSGNRGVECICGFVGWRGIWRESIYVDAVEMKWKTETTDE